MGILPLKLAVCNGMLDLYVLPNGLNGVIQRKQVVHHNVVGAPQPEPPPVSGPRFIGGLLQLSGGAEKVIGHGGKDVWHCVHHRNRHLSLGHVTLTSTVS